MFSKYQFTASERFMRYVQIDTQSDPQSNTYPSTEKQKDLGKILAAVYRDWETDRKSTRLNSSHRSLSRMPSSA